MTYPENYDPRKHNKGRGNWFTRLFMPKGKKKKIKKPIKYPKRE